MRPVLPPYDDLASCCVLVNLPVQPFKDRGLLAIAAIAVGSGLGLAVLQQGLLRLRPPISSHSSAELLRRSSRFDPDPSRRREARLLLAQSLNEDPRAQLQLLRGQGWSAAAGPSLLAAVALKQQAQAEQKIGNGAAAQRLWRQLLQRFPLAPPSADALYALGDSGGPERQLLLQRFPAHPAALAAALEWDQRLGGALGGLHLARWGERWPGAAPAMARACQRPHRPLTPNEKDLLAGGLAHQGELAAAKRCLGALPPQTARTRERLAPAVLPPLTAAELGWERSRQLLLKRQWAAASASLQKLDPQRQSPPLAARSRFWLGLAAQQLGQTAQAQKLWTQQLQSYPYGYYAWRASERLGLSKPARPLPPPAPTAGLLAPPLAQLEQLGLHGEAWEHWRTWRGGRAPANPQDLWREGQLRLALGDRWMGLAQLDQASLEGAAKTPAQLRRLEQQRHPLAFETELQNAALQAGLDPSLLIGVARQESRLSPAVGSPAGAVGLLQLMPATANELASSSLSRAQLEDPNLNAQLGARYLQQLFKAFANNPFLAVASYNAGPGAAQGWGNLNLKQIPELWVEAIPYPETRLYVKSVLGNRWTYGLLEPSLNRP